LDIHRVGDSDRNGDIVEYDGGAAAADRNDG